MPRGTHGTYFNRKAEENWRRNDLPGGSAVPAGLFIPAALWPGDSTQSKDSQPLADGDELLAIAQAEIVLILARWGRHLEQE